MILGVGVRVPRLSLWYWEWVSGCPKYVVILEWVLGVRTVVVILGVGIGVPGLSL